MPDERSPLLQFPGMGGGGGFDGLGDHHSQFCHLVGLKPFTHPPGQPWKPHGTSLYSRATRHKRNQGFTYLFTATLTNGLLLSQVVLGAALTALGASDSSRVLITVFGALNTVIAGLPVRARMFRDELARIVDEIENSAVMWHGVAKGVHGYDAIDTNDEVTVRSEVARLTRLYDRAIKNSTINDPDSYAAGMTGDPYSAALRTQPGQAGGAATSAPAVQAPATGVTAAPAEAVAPQVVAAPVVDPDDSPATQAPEPAKPREPEPSKAKEPEPRKDVEVDKAEYIAVDSDAPKPDTSVSPPAIEPAKPDPSGSSTQHEADGVPDDKAVKPVHAAPGSGDALPTPSPAQPQEHTEDTSQ
ncbi:hypothetical protein LTR53_001616 [Teratosphaeriaceae sp. CCFEE 6253]|nr:hypothetical protein LTR53_001616 [Teratosphaeriaceae sp. CCFEE 6253]